MKYLYAFLLWLSAAAVFADGTVPLEDTYTFDFSTVAPSTGAPATLGGTPAIEVYEEGSTTQITAGDTLTVDLDSVTGLHHVDLACTAANGYEAGKWYSAVIAGTTPTVDSVSVAGRVVARFRVVAQEGTAGTPKCDVSLIGGSSTPVTNLGIVFNTDFATNYDTTNDMWNVDVEKVGGTAYGTALLDAAGIRAALGLASANLDTQLSTIDTNVDSILDDTGTSGVQIPAGEIVAATFGAGAIDASAIAADAIGASEIATDAIGAAEIATDAIGANEIAANAIGASEIATDAIGSAEVAAGAIVYGTEFTGTVNAAVTSLGANVVTAASTASDFIAEINAEIVDALATDTYAEPGQGTPAATTTLAAKINYLYKAWRNKKDTDGSVTNYYNDAGDTVDHKASVGEAAGTTTVGEVATGP